MTPRQMLGARLNLVCFGPAHIYAVGFECEEMVVYARSTKGVLMTLSLAYAALVIA